ncbi:MAG: VIT1/CCC1 transporter family protein [Candidatus Omnitrophica bacterium]|nr:VIT1/CCC1 transporter family protein [Candidatus Omnitrophota bacterium]
MDEDIRKRILGFQKNEITEYHIYTRLALSVKDSHNSEVLKRIADDELRHYGIWKKHSQEDVAPDEAKIWVYFLISRILGLTFGVKLMERGEGGAQIAYKAISKDVPEATDIAREEDGHEKELIGLINEERLKYVGSVVLGLNDALVELTGALAGLTLALQNSRLIAAAGLVMGIAASFSMAASEYLSTKSEAGTEGAKNPLKASIYTGIAYIFTVMFLIFPFLISDNLYLSLTIMFANALVVIAAFTFYVSVAKDVCFKKRFLEMAGIGFGVALLSFGMGYIIRHVLGVNA